MYICTHADIYTYTHCCLIRQEDLLIRGAQIVNEASLHKVFIGGNARPLRCEVQEHYNFLYSCLFSGPLGVVSLPERAPVSPDGLSVSHPAPVPWVVVEGFQGVYAEGSPWLLEVSARAVSKVHRDCAPSTPRVDVKGHGGSILTLVVCLHASKPYTMRFFSVESRSAPSLDDSECPYVDVVLRPGSWQLFPSRLWHVVITPSKRLIASIMFQLAS